MAKGTKMTIENITLLHVSAIILNLIWLLGLTLIYRYATIGLNHATKQLIFAIIIIIFTSYLALHSSKLLVLQNEHKTLITALEKQGIIIKTVPLIETKTIGYEYKFVKIKAEKTLTKTTNNYLQE